MVTTTTNTSLSLERFADKLLEEKNMQHLDQETLKQVKEDIINHLNDHVDRTILASLPEDKASELEQLLDKKASAKTLQEFCQAAVPDLDEVVARAMLTFRDAYLNP